MRTPTKLHTTREPSTPPGEEVEWEYEDTKRGPFCVVVFTGKVTARTWFEARSIATRFGGSVTVRPYGTRH